MNLQEETIVRELEKNPNIRITELERLTDLSIGEIYRIRYLWKLEKKREIRQWHKSLQNGSFPENDPMASKILL